MVSVVALGGGCRGRSRMRRLRGNTSTNTAIRTSQLKIGFFGGGKGELERGRYEAAITAAYVEGEGDCEDEENERHDRIKHPRNPPRHRHGLRGGTRHRTGAGGEKWAMFPCQQTMFCSFYATCVASAA